MDPCLLLTRCDGLLLGALLASALPDRARLERHRPAFGAAFVAVALVAALPVAGLFLGKFLASAWFARVNVVFACVVGLTIAYAGHPALRPLRARWLSGVGAMSYGLYLYHPFVFTAVGLLAFRLGVKAPVRMDLVRLAATFGVAWLSWRYVEQPILSLKDRFPYGSDERRGHARVALAGCPPRDVMMGEALPARGPRILGRPDSPLSAAKRSSHSAPAFPGLWLDPASLQSGDLRRLRQVVDQGVATPEYAAGGERPGAGPHQGPGTP
jgi:hypothetical protein